MKPRLRRTILSCAPAELFFEKLKTKPAVAITLEKKIPYGAGLGGGSSDAAATLLGLNKFFEADLTQEQLVELAAKIGSDVPFFIYHSAAAVSRTRRDCFADEDQQPFVAVASQAGIFCSDAVGIFALERFTRNSECLLLRAGI